MTQKKKTTTKEVIERFNKIIQDHENLITEHPDQIYVITYELLGEYNQPLKRPRIVNEYANTRQEATQQRIDKLEKQKQEGIITDYKIIQTQTYNEHTQNLFKTIH